MALNASARDSANRNLFNFWLLGEQDPDPAKAEQYARWHELRQLQEENEKKAMSGAVSHQPR